MKIRTQVWWFVLSIAVVGAAACGDNMTAKPDDTDDGTTIALADGDVRGSEVGTSRQFLGIPYARPPVGALRWKPPERPAPWSEPLDARRFGKRCAQLASPTLQNAASTDEDCLYLNVWAPAKAQVTAALPVMVWLHGGGNINGSTSEPVPFVNIGVFYTGQHLAEDHGVVMVSLNYRLGIFGFFDAAELAAEGGGGNQGLLDQQLALRWVHDNIAAFGGDPGNVTIFGESAGSFDVCMHVAAPTSAGLFHRAISESGGCTTRLRTKAEAATAAARFATDAGCAGAGALACLRGKSAAELMATSDVALGVGFGPDVDGAFMPDQPRARYDAGQIAKVPYVLGSNTDEGTLFLGTTKVTNQTEYAAALDQMFGARAAAVADLYLMADFAGAMPNAAEAALARVIGDSRLVCPTLDTAARVAHAGAAVYMYNFDIPAPIVIQNGYLGATHGSELTSVFGTSPAFTTETKAASDLIQRYWTRFAAKGDPNGGSDLTWPPYTEAHDARINFALQPTVVTDFRAARCAFWRAGYAAQF